MFVARCLILDVVLAWPNQQKGDVKPNVWSWHWALLVSQDIH